MEDMHIHVRDLLESKVSVSEYVNKFDNYNINRVCFLEHSKRISLNHKGYLVDYSSYNKLYELVNYMNSEYDFIKFYTGIEIDYSSDLELRKEILDYLKKCKFDYVIGSVHGFKSLCSTDYYNMVIDMINNYPIDIIGHLRLFDTWKEDKDKLKEIIILCNKKNIKIEINTSDRSIWSLEQFDFMYNEMKKNNVNYTIGSDAHDVGQICQNYDLINNWLTR